MAANGWSLQLRTFVYPSRACHTEPGPGRVPVIRGRYLQPFLLEDAAPDTWVEETACRHLAGPEWDRFRLGVRGVTQGLNARSLCATVLPPRTATNASVHVSMTPESLDDLLVLAVLLNSLVADWEARRLLQLTAAPYLYHQLHLPVPEPALRVEMGDLALSLLARDPRFRAPAAERWVSPPENDLDAGRLRLRLEVLAAKAYGLGLSGWQTVLSDFPLVEPGYRWALYEAYAREAIWKL